MIIVCPNCQSRYELANQAIGAAGRKVKCANCANDWRAFPHEEPVADDVALHQSDARNDANDDALFSPSDEMALDAAFEAAEAEEVAQQQMQAPEPQDSEAPLASRYEPRSPSEMTNFADEDIVDEVELKRRRDALERRHAILARNLPRNKLHRWTRMTLLVLLMTLILGGIMFRDRLVEAFPELAALYGVLGIEMNIVGLDFENVKTIRTLRDGAETLLISADIVNVTTHQVVVPRVHVDILDAGGAILYEWNANPQATALGAGERLEFSTQLVTPPDAAEGLSLGFVDYVDNHNH